jgi:hypothetical protein
MRNHISIAKMPGCLFKLPYALLFCLSAMFSGCSGSGPMYDPQATIRDIFNGERLRLTAEYCFSHYGVYSHELHEPRMIVVHYTAFPTLEESYRFFAPTMLDTVLRGDISSGGQVNLSPHYFI